jgi:long-chain acyl-CoA synthetase
MSEPEHPRPWLDLYQTSAASISPEATTGLDMFRSTLARDPDATLAFYFDRALTAGALDAMSSALAASLEKRGVGHGDRVGMWLQNIPQAFIAVLAVWKCGGVIVPCNPMLREQELAKILRASGCRVLICQDDLFGGVGEAALPSTDVQHTITTSALDFLTEGAPRPKLLAGMSRQRHAGTDDMLEIIVGNSGQRPREAEISGSDVAFMVYTSGTTGDPKGAMNTHSNVVFATSVYQHWIGLDASDRILGLAPLFHVTGLIGHVTLAMLTGSPLILFYRFDADEACRLAEQHKATFTVSAITAFIAILNSGALSKYDISSMQKLYTGGAPTPPSVLEQWHQAAGARIHPMYGLTEATSPTHMTPFGATAPVDAQTGAMSIGVPVYNTFVKVIADAGFVAEPGEIGEFVIDGPQIVPGYWQKPNETARAICDDGLRTGDVGFMDQKGWFYLVDRSKDMIVASGFKVWPREVEDVLYQHPAVREAAVVGVPDPYRGETIKAVVSLKAGVEATTEEIRAFARERLAAYKYPRIVEFMDELPKTTSGKIMRRLLQPTTIDAAVPMEAAESQLATVSYPQLRAAVEARAVLEAGAVWLRLSRGRLPLSTSEALYGRLQKMLTQLSEEGRYVDRDAFLLANKEYHAAIVSLADNEHLARGFERLRLRQLYRSALKDQSIAVANIVYFHEHLTDSIVAGNAVAALQTIMSWSKQASVRVRRILESDLTGSRADSELKFGGVVEDLSVGIAPEQEDLAGDVDALAQALDARAAIEIGITQSLGHALSIQAQGEALVARLRAFTPLVRGRSPAHVARYIRADDAYHRVFLSLLRNPYLFEIYNAMDLPELMRRVLETAPPTIREVFDDHKALTNALRAGDSQGVAVAITEHANHVRTALREFLKSDDAAATMAAQAS